MGKENTYICEECGFKSDTIKVCCGKKLVNIENTTKVADNMCGCC